MGGEYYLSIIDSTIELRNDALGGSGYGGGIQGPRSSGLRGITANKGVFRECWDMEILGCGGFRVQSFKV